MLGVALAPDSGTYQKTEAMLHLANQWSDGMRTGKVKRDEAWLAITSVIMKTTSIESTMLSHDSICTDLWTPAIGVC
jgi:hypothetical protein